MKFDKVLFIVLLIFVVGMVVGVGDVSASHTLKYGKYKGKVSDKQYKKLKSTLKHDGYITFNVKTGSFYKVYDKVKYKKVVYKRYRVFMNVEVYEGSVYVQFFTKLKVLDGGRVSL